MKRKLRVLLLMHEDLVPPDSIEGLSAFMASLPVEMQNDLARMSSLRASSDIVIRSGYLRKKREGPMSFRVFDQVTLFAPSVPSECPVAATLFRAYCWLERSSRMVVI